MPAPCSSCELLVIKVAEVRFSPVLQGIFQNREPEPNGRGTTGRTQNRTCWTTRFRFKLGSDRAEPSISFSVVKQHWNVHKGILLHGETCKKHPKCGWCIYGGFNCDFRGGCIASPRPSDVSSINSNNYESATVGLVFRTFERARNTVQISRIIN